MASILIIDDERAIRNVLKDILNNEGYTTDEATDGEEGLKKFKLANFDLVLCDIKMPKIDGILWNGLNQINSITGDCRDLFFCS